MFTEEYFIDPIIFQMSVSSTNLFLSSSVVHVGDTSQTLMIFADMVLALDHTYAAGKSNSASKLLDEICLLQREKDHTYSTSSRPGRVGSTKLLPSTSRSLESQSQNCILYSSNSSKPSLQNCSVSAKLDISVRRSSSEDNISRANANHDFIQSGRFEKNTCTNNINNSIMPSRKSVSFERVFSMSPPKPTCALEKVLQFENRKTVNITGPSQRSETWPRKEDHTYATFDSDNKTDIVCQSFSDSTTYSNNISTFVIGQHRNDHTYDRCFPQNTKPVTSDTYTCHSNPNSNNVLNICPSVSTCSSDHNYFSCVQQSQHLKTCFIGNENLCGASVQRQAVLLQSNSTASSLCAFDHNYSTMA